MLFRSLPLFLSSTASWMSVKHALAYTMERAPRETQMREKMKLMQFDMLALGVATTRQFQEPPTTKQRRWVDEMFWLNLTRRSWGFLFLFVNWSSASSPMGRPAFAVRRQPLGTMLESGLRLCASRRLTWKTPVSHRRYWMKWSSWNLGWLVTRTGTMSYEAGLGGARVQCFTVISFVCCSWYIWSVVDALFFRYRCCWTNFFIIILLRFKAVELWSG